MPRGHALGVTLQLPLDDRYNYSKSYLLARIAVALAGRVAEELVFNEITTGAENDLEMVSAIVHQMVTRWGMDAGAGLLVQAERHDGDLGSLLRQRETSDHRAKEVDAAMQAITTERLAYTRKLLSENLDKLHKLAALLLEHESADADTIRTALGWTDRTVHATADSQQNVLAPEAAAAYKKDAVELGTGS
jgi:cell division protease FtsH